MPLSFKRVIVTVSAEIDGSLLTAPDGLGRPVG
jgi:hypothetical protein